MLEAELQLVVVSVCCNLEDFVQMSTKLYSVFAELKGLSYSCVQEHSILLKLYKYSVPACTIFTVKAKWMSEAIASSSFVLETNDYSVEFIAILLPYDRGKLKLIISKEDGSKFPFDRGKIEVGD